MMLDTIQIQNILPHRYPFLLIDKVLDLTIGDPLAGTSSTIQAYKNVTISEPVFQGHFPDHPIYPGVMILEGMAQSGGVLAFKSALVKDPTLDVKQKVVYFMSIDKAKFRKPVLPGDQLLYKITIIKERSLLWVLKGEAYANDCLVSEALLTAKIVDK